MLKCITIDDEPLALRQMVSYIEKTPFLSLTAGLSNAIEALELVQQTHPDLLFIDINMPELNGMDFVKSLKNPCMVIFTTAYSEYAVEGFKVDAVDYLLKPIGYSDFLKAANKALQLFEMRNSEQESTTDNEEYLFVKSEYKTVKINFSDILYIEGMREYVRIHFIDCKQTPVMTLLSMKSLEERLSKKSFMRVHRSFIVNLKHVNIIERSRIVFDKETYIPVGEQYKEIFQEYLDKRSL